MQLVKANKLAAARVARIEPLILTIRGQRVMLDSDLARIYHVTTGQLNQALKRNTQRFPADFAFRLARQEFVTLISQSVISKAGRGGRQTSLSPPARAIGFHVRHEPEAPPVVPPPCGRRK